MLILDCGSISGESTIKGYTGKIEVFSYSSGITQPITSGASSQKRIAGKPDFEDFTVTKNVDVASIGLIEHCAQGIILPTVVLTVARSEAGTVTPFLVYTLTNALVSAVTVSGGGGDLPQETVAFNFAEISWAYKTQAPDGSTHAGTTGWNLATNAQS